MDAPPANSDWIDEEFLDALPDPEIRQAFKRLLRGYARRKRTRRS
jgi:hypothetical protein